MALLNCHPSNDIYLLLVLTTLLRDVQRLSARTANRIVLLLLVLLVLLVLLLVPMFFLGDDGPAECTRLLCPRVRSEGHFRFLSSPRVRGCSR